MLAICFSKLGCSYFQKFDDLSESDGSQPNSDRDLRPLGVQRLKVLDAQPHGGHLVAATACN